MSLIFCLWAVAIIIPLLQGDAFIYQDKLDISELKLIFNEDECIDGTLSVSESGSTVHPLIVTESEILSSKGNSFVTIEEKTPMSKINELARFNKITYAYTLTREVGPAHNKRFTVSLTLGEEEYSGEGTNIKNAQHNAARTALNSTKYQLPNIKPDVKPKVNRKSVSKLEIFINNRWDVPIKYSFQDKTDLESGKYHRNIFHKNMYTQLELYTATVTIDELKFTGKGLSKDIAKEKAANNALVQLQKLDGICTLDSEIVSYLHNSDKSPMSIINEFASKSKLSVNCDTSGEEGPAHMKIFTVKCSIGNKFVSYGKGENKKSAKNEAAKNMLKHLEAQPLENSVNCGSLYRKGKVIKSMKKQKLLRSEKSTQPEKYTHSFPVSMNPISKLMEIYQRTHNSQPIFTLLDDGRSTKQFSMQVKVGDLEFVGSGPNKKTAKREAAQGMLKLLGYSHTSDGIKVSLPKEKKKEFSNKHITKNKRHLVSGISINSESSTIPIHKNDFNDVTNPAHTLKDDLKEESKGSNERSNKVKPSNFKAPMSQLDNISKLLGFKYQFSNFPKSNNTGYVSLLSLTTDPPKVCLGAATTNSQAEENAALSALENLYKTHIDAISDVLRGEITEDESDNWSSAIRQTIIQEEIVTEL